MVARRGSRSTANRASAWWSSCAMRPKSSASPRGNGLDKRNARRVPRNTSCNTDTESPNGLPTDFRFRSAFGRRTTTARCSGVSATFSADRVRKRRRRRFTGRRWFLQGQGLRRQQSSVLSDQQRPVGTADRSDHRGRYVANHVHRAAEPA